MIAASVEISDEDRADFERDWAVRRSDVTDNGRLLSATFTICRRSVRDAEEAIGAGTAASMGS